MFKKVIALLMLLVITLDFVACGGEKELTGLGRFYGLDPEIELEITRAYYNNKYSDQESIDMQPIKQYYGTFNDCIVIGLPYSKWIVGVVQYGWQIIDVYLFATAYLSIWAWKDGELYYLSEAFEEGLLAKEDLKNIYERHKDCHLLCEGVYYICRGESEFIEKDVNNYPNLYDREYIYKLLDLYKEKK